MGIVSGVGSIVSGYQAALACRTIRRSQPLRYRPKGAACLIFFRASMTWMPTNRPWLSNDLKIARKWQDLRQSGRTISTKLDCRSRGEFMSLVAALVRYAVRSHHDQVLSEQ